MLGLVDGISSRCLEGSRLFDNVMFRSLNNFGGRSMRLGTMF